MRPSIFSQQSSLSRYEIALPILMFRRSRPEITRVTRELTLLNEHGLHARPATEFVRCALMFESCLTIVAGGRRYRADRIMEVLLANLNRGDSFVLEAEGADAEQAAERLDALLIFLKEAEDRAQNARNPNRGVVD
jgi:phosphocarrier protein HPr